MKKPHYRLHCHLDDCKPTWWVSTVKRVGGMRKLVKTNGYSSPRAAVEAAARYL